MVIDGKMKLIDLYSGARMAHGGTKIFGIGAAEVPDKKGEIISVDGMDISFCSFINDEHVNNNLSIVGAVTKVKKIIHEKQAVTAREKQCWEAVQRPFVYFEAVLADDEGHPNAAATAALVKFANVQPDLPFKVGASVQGLTLKRGGKEGTPEHKNLVSTIAEGFSVTAKPCNPACLVFPWSTLEKSEMTEAEMKLVSQYLPKDPNKELLAATEELLGLVDSLDMEVLNKVLDDWDKGGTASLKCHMCGGIEKLFKSSRNWPNRCNKCGKPYAMQQIWDAFNQ